jgi:hypothetical protein
MCEDLSDPAMEFGRSTSCGDLAGEGSRMLGDPIGAIGSGDIESIWCSAEGVSSLSRSTELGMVSGSFVVVMSESAIDPAYSVTDDTEGVSEVIDRVPESSRTRNCEIEGLRLPVGEVERLGAVSPLSGLAGRLCCARMS